MLWRAGKAGLLAGMLLGVLLMVVCAVTGYRLDQVLLDLSYTFLAEYNIPLVQWVVHLIVSLVVSGVYATLVLRLLRGGVWIGGIFGALTGLVYFVLVPYVAPELQGNTWPFLLWTACHVVYGVALDQMVSKKSRS